MSKTSTAGRFRYLPPIMITAGSALLLYVAVQYAHMFLQQRRLAREWQRQQAVASLQVDSDSDGALTRLSIPSIHLDAIVVEGTTRHDLLLGPGHIKGTAEAGQPGNVVITGHRDTFFRHVHELRKGDIVILQREGKTYRYEVTAKRIVGAEDVSVLRPAGDSGLTLITCYPTYYIGPAPNRLVVFTKKVGDGQSPPLVSTVQARPSQLNSH